MNIATSLADFLVRRGVQRVFGLPGTETIELIEAMRGAGIEFVLTHHESTAAFAATMTGHLTGQPGVCVVAGGPGVANATTGILAAHLDRMPLCVVIGDHVAAPSLPTHQRLPFEHVASGIVRDRLAASPATFATDLPRLFAAAEGPLPGPVLLSITTEAVMQQAEPAPASPGATGGSPSEVAARVRPLVEALNGAGRVIIAIGIGVTHGDPGTRLVRLAERLGAPVTDTPQSKGWFPNDHPLYVGTIATRRNQDITTLGDRADLVLALGLDSAELLGPWPLRPPVVSLAPAGSADGAIPSTIALDAPIGPAIDEMLHQLPDHHGGWRHGEIEACARSVRDGLIPDASERPAAGMWPQQAVAILQQELPVDAVVTTDVGSHKLLMVQQWVARTPNSFLCSTGLSPMGTGLAFAVAARLAWPRRPVAAVIGDGGFLMYTGEMATLRRLDGPLALVVMRDNALSSIRVKQARKGYPATGTLIQGGLDLAGVARGFGLEAVRVEDPHAYREAVRHASAASQPMVIEAVVDPRGYEWSQ